MIKTKPIYALAALLLCGCAASNVPARADVTRVEAETKLAAGDMKVLDLPDASGGKAVSIARDWQPLVVAPIPATGDAFTVWVRYRDKPVLVKGSPGGEQKDLQWLYDTPTTLTWKKAGRFTRAQIGDNLIVIRGGDGGEGPILDAIVFATDENYDPNTDTNAAPKTDAAPNNANINEGAAVALGMKDQPEGIFIEAETNAPGGAAKIIDAAGASGGKAVQSSGDWQPVFQAPLPAGDAWKVWVRHKGGPFAVKTQADGKGTDRWYWNKPTDWKWTETDVFSREELGGKQLILGRDAGGDKADSVIIDAVVLAPATKKPLPAAAPNAEAAPQKIAASVDWNRNAGAIPVALWGINENEISKPADAANALYQSELGALNAPLVRIHNADLVNRWTSAEKHDWDVEKIKAGFAASKGYGDAQLMININK